MSYRMRSDDDILLDLAAKVENIRISKHLKESEIEAIAGISRKTFYNFKKGTSSISLKNFIRLLRAVDELDRLEGLFPTEDHYSPRKSQEKEPPKRVRDKAGSNKSFKWGDES